MFDVTRRLAAAILKVPLTPPDPPAGSKGSTAVFRASPRYLTYKLLPFWLSAAWSLAIYLAVGVAGFAEGGPVVRVLVVAGGLFVVGGLFVGYCAIRLDYELRYYVLTDRSIRIREGAWLLREMTLTHANVQDVSISQGPLQRVFRIADVVVKTAGGGGATAAQPGGSGHQAMLAGVEDAAAVRDRIRAYLGRQPDDGGLGDDAAAARPAPAPAPRADGAATAAALREVVVAARALREAAERRRAAEA